MFNALRKTSSIIAFKFQQSLNITTTFQSPQNVKTSDKETKWSKWRNGNQPLCCQKINNFSIQLTLLITSRGSVVLLTIRLWLPPVQIPLRHVCGPNGCVIVCIHCHRFKSHGCPISFYSIIFLQLP